MTKTTVKRHKRKGTKGVKSHTRVVEDQHVPHYNVEITKSQQTRIRRFKERLKKATKTEINEGIDIANFSQNDEGFYSSRYVPTVKNFARKQKKGILNKDLARLGMSNHVSDLIKRYNKYNGMEGHYFSPETKAVIADELVDMDWDEIKDGTWN